MGGVKAGEQTGTNRRVEHKQGELSGIISARGLGLVLAVVLVGVAITPAASADTSSKTVCIGDSEHVDPPTVGGAGCANDWIETRTDKCTVDASDGLRDCVIEGRLGVTVHGLETCGRSTSSWFEKAAEECVDLADGSSDSETTAWEEIAKVKNVSDDGTVVTVPVKACVSPQHPEAEAYCDSYTHRHRIPATADASATEPATDDPVEASSVALDEATTVSRPRLAAPVPVQVLAGASSG